MHLHSKPGLNELSTRQRMRIVGWCYLCSFAYWQTWAPLILATVFALAGQMAVRFTMPALTTFQAPLYGLWGGVVAWLLGSYVCSKIRGQVVRKLIRKQFPQLCQECGYDLRATAGRCPECGHSQTSTSTETIILQS